MTTETRTLIEFSDISGIEIECPECHLKVLFPVSKLFKIGSGCPHCNCKWFDEYMDKAVGHYPAIDQIQKIAEQLRVFTRKDRTDIHAIVRCHIASEAPDGN